MRIKENLVEEFDEFSGDYTRDMVHCVPHYSKLVSSIVEYLPDRFSAENILDMGPGNGNTIACLIEQYPKATYFLVDASPEMLKICRDRFKELHIETTEGYFNEYEFEEGRYDLITASFSFHHINTDEKKEIFKKIQESLRQGGIFGYSDLMIHKSNPDHPALIEEWGAFVKGNYGDDEKWHWLMEHYDAFDQPDNLEDQLNWLRRSGFSKVQVLWNQGYWAHVQAIK